MDFKTFLENFDAIAEAPGGIPKLRSLILDLAVRGKLVPQNSEDEPASVLLDKLRFEKDRLIREGKIKGSKTLPPINLADMPFAPPDGWEWVHLENLVEVITKGSSPKWQGVNYVNPGSGILFITSENVRNYVLDVSNPKYVEAKFNEIEPRSILQKNDLLMNIVGASIGRTAIYELDEIANINQAVCLIRLINSLPLLNHAYMLLFFNSAVCINFMFDKQVDNARANLSMGNIAKFPIPLPPLAEQKRIVEKVDELMGLCDRYEAAKQTRDNLRQKLRESAIASLMNAATDKELDAAWAIVRDNWHNLSQQPEDVDGLRKSVLQLAARGKLVPQEQRDECANQLLQKAIQEKALMAQAGLIPKPKQSLPISEDDCPFSLPSSWAWVRLENICSHIVDCLHRTPKYQDEGYPAIRTSEMQPGKILFDQARKVGREEYELQTQRLVPKAGDIFYSREGSFGIAAVVPEGVEICLSQRMMQFRPVSEVNSNFFSWIMNSSVMYEQAARDVVGMTVPHVNIRSLKEFVFPLAPYAEQKRIVAKVEELMQLCDQLEASLHQSQQRAESLAASAISHLTI
jgi:type I restriction enzyme S subunit